MVTVFGVTEEKSTEGDWVGLVDWVRRQLRRVWAVISLVYGALWSGLSVEFAGERPGAATASAVIAVACLAVAWRGLRSGEGTRAAIAQLPSAKDASRIDTSSIFENWFLLRAGQESGPHSMEEVRAAIDDGLVTRGDFVRHGNEEWRPAELSYFGSFLASRPESSREPSVWPGIALGVLVTLGVVLLT